MVFRYKICLKNELGTLYVNESRLTKSKKKLLLKITECFCENERCNCITEFSLPLHLVDSYELGNAAKPDAITYNSESQFYKGIQLNLIKRNYNNEKARRFRIGDTKQNVWIPIKHLEVNGTIKPGEDIDYVFRQSPRQLEYAGYKNPIIGIKRANMFADIQFGKNVSR